MNNKEKLPWNLLWKAGIGKLGISEITLLSYLYENDHSGKYGGGIRVSIPEIEKATGLSRTTLHVAKRGLEQKGLIKVLGRRNHDNVNAYDLTPIRQKLRSLRKIESVRSQAARLVITIRHSSWKVAKDY